MKKIILSGLLTLGLWASQTHTAKVLETLNSGGYTYIKVEENTKSYWIAMTQRFVKPGEKISFDEQGWMQNFHSKTLNRTFDTILFASDSKQVQAEKREPLENIVHSDYKIKNTLSIAELFENRQRYAGKKVKIRAKVTKVSSAIMKRNWVHLQDGSRFQNEDDLVLTSSDALPSVGSVVIAEGIAVTDKDFGYGYFYPVMVEDTSFTPSAKK